MGLKEKTLLIMLQIVYFFQVLVRVHVIKLVKTRKTFHEEKTALKTIPQKKVEWKMENFKGRGITGHGGSSSFTMHFLLDT